MAVLRPLAVVLVTLLVSACGSSPSSPSSSLPPANLQLSGDAAWTDCSNALQSCVFTASMANIGTGCAANVTVVARILDASGGQLGPDVQMGAAGSLSGRTIRPNEVIALTSLTRVSLTIATTAVTYRLFPVWTNTRCT